LTPLLWHGTKMTPREIRAGVDIRVEAGSMRRPSKQQQMLDASEIMVDFTNMVGAVTQQGYQIEPEEFADKLNYVFGTKLDAMGREDRRQITFNFENLKAEPLLMRQRQEPPADRELLDQNNIVEFVESVKQLPPDAQEDAVAEYVGKLPKAVQQEAQAIALNALGAAA
jgi:hypothetical protein